MKRISLSKLQTGLCLLWGALIVFSFSGCGAFDPLGESGVGLKLYLAGNNLNIFSYDIFRNESKLIYKDPSPMPGSYTALTVDSKNKMLYFFDNMSWKIYRCKLDGSSKEEFFDTSGQGILAMTFNPNKRSIFASTPGGIYELVLETKQWIWVPSSTGGASCLAWDDVHSMLYWGNSYYIYKLPNTQIYSGAYTINSLTINTSENKLYWIEFGGPSQVPVYSAPVDNVYAKTELYALNLSLTRAVIDPRSKNIYWTESFSDGFKLFVKGPTEQTKFLYQFPIDAPINFLTIDLWP